MEYNFSIIESMNDRGGMEFSPECKAQFDHFFGGQPQELVQRYCEAVNFKIILLFIFVGIMWLFQPMVKRLLEEHNKSFLSTKTIMFLYKWIGLGLMFIGIYGLIML